MDSLNTQLKLDTSSLLVPYPIINVPVSSGRCGGKIKLMFTIEQREGNHPVFKKMNDKNHDKEERSENMDKHILLWGWEI